MPNQTNIIIASMLGNLIETLAEMFPINVRCTVLSLLYATAASIAAGLTL